MSSMSLGGAYGSGPAPDAFRSGRPAPPGMSRGPMGPAPPLQSRGAYGPPPAGGSYGPPPPGYYPPPSAATCCGTAPGQDGLPPVQTFVGMGRGDYVLKTQYAYVGRGAGEYTPQAVERRPVQLYWCLGVGCLALLLLVPLLLYLFEVFSPRGVAPNHGTASAFSAPSPAPAISVAQPRPTPATAPFVPADTAQTSPSVITPADGQGTCAIWGDPHVKVFDSANLNGALPVTFLLNGDYWLVRSMDIWIQGRYEADTWDNGFASLHGIAVGGSFLGSDKIIVGPKSGKVYFNNREILRGMPGSFISPNGNDQIHAMYKEHWVTLDNNERKRVSVVDLHLPRGVMIRVNRWPRHIDAIIHMHPVNGQDGACGNFDGNFHDDTKELIARRVPDQVPAAKNLFPPTVFNMDNPTPYTVQDCPAETLRQATSRCQAANAGAGQALVSACVLDVCRNGLQMVNEDATTVKMAGR